MRIAPLDDRLVGERLGHAVFDGRGRVLLEAGVELTPAYLQVLRRRGYLSVPLHDPLAPDAVPVEVVREQVRRGATSTIRHALREADAEGGVAVDHVAKVVDQILDEIGTNADLAYNVTCLRSLKDGIFFHSVNTCIYTLIAASCLALPREDQRHLGIGAMLHDIGKIYYLDLVSKPGPLTDEEAERIRRHPIDGFELLRRQRNISLLAAHVAFQHHERLDGSGYPRGLRGDQIHPWAQAAAVADVYDTITADRTYGKGLPPHAAMAAVKELADAGQLSPVFVRHLMLHVAAYPEGTIVQLATGEIAVVVAQTAKGGTRPRVRVVTDGKLRLTDPGERTIDGRAPETTVSQVLADYPKRVRRQLRLQTV